MRPRLPAPARSTPTPAPPRRRRRLPTAAAASSPPRRRLLPSTPSQNRRARWKTKQLEKDYDALKRQLDAVKADNDALLSHNKKLQAEVCTAQYNSIITSSICCVD